MTVCSVVLKFRSEAAEMSLDLSSDYLHFNFGMAKACRHGGYAFGDFRLDRDKKMLYRGETEISLPPKVVETLIVLVENQGEIVSKAELMEKVWSDSVVEESNLSQHLYLLRKTLGDLSNGKPVIETLRRRGYRFNAPTSLIEPDTETGFSPRAPTGNLSVKRQGNVLTVTDWEAAVEPGVHAATDQRASLSIVRPTTGRPIFAYAAVGLAMAVGLLLLGYWFWSDRGAANTRSTGDIQISYLTNGRPVEGVTISPDGKYFVYDELETPISRLWLQQPGQANRVEIIPEAEWVIGAKTFSPDGRFVYFVAREKGDEVSNLYRVPTLGGPYAKVLANVATPVSFSPDGREMAFIRFNSEPVGGELVVASSDGNNGRVILQRTGEQALGAGTAWSPDGRLIAFSSVGAVDQKGFLSRSLEAIELSSGHAFALSPEGWDTCYRMQWAYDGQGLFFIGTAYADGNSPRRDQLYYLAYPSGKVRRLTNEGNRHDPSSLGVTSNGEVVVLATGRSSQLWAMDASGDSGTAVQLTRGLFDGRAGIAPLPDGRVGYISRTGENVNVWIMNADGSGQRQLTSEPSFAEELRASPDGRFFVFSSERDRQSDLFRINPDGSGLAPITEGKSSEIDSSVSPDGAWVAYGTSTFEGGRWKSFIWKIPSAGGPPEQVGRRDCTTPHFSPDGQLISCVFEENRIEILRTVDGAVVSTLTPRPLAKLNFGVPWTPDGESVVYISNDKGTANLWTHPIKTGEPHRLTDFNGGDIYRFAFSTDGNRVFLARGYPIHDALMIRNFR